MSPIAVARGYVPRAVKNAVRRGERLLRVLPVSLSRRQVYTCPICGYCGPFLDDGPRFCRNANAQCVRCGAIGRQRLQYCVLDEFFRTYEPSGRSAIHFAPETHIARYLRQKFGTYHTADLNPREVDFQADLRCLPFADGSYDFVFASHVLEHIDDDRRALSEIARILRPEGVAMLPVPVIGATTVEYPHPVAAEAYHVRAPGLDYFERYSAYFRTVNVKSSDDYPPRFQLYIYEDRLAVPRDVMPYRPAVSGYRHCDYVPICRL
jgi:SAM-dependent methyltransferase